MSAPQRLLPAILSLSLMPSSLCVFGCAPSSAAEPARGAPAQAEKTPRATTSDTPPPRAASAEVTSPTASSKGAAPPPDPFAGATFPPPDFAPPFERSAQPGDGHWEIAPQAGQVGGEPIMYRTSLRPHLYKRFAFVNVVAVDLSRTAIHLVPGTREPVTQALDESQRTGLVPEAVQPDLAAVFNGGFMTKHGGHGMGVGEVDLLPPRPELCSIALLADGHVRIGTWSNIHTEKSQFRAWRQGPWCLIEGGVMNPNVKNAQRRKYGMSAEGKLEIRRSAVGISRDGGTLFYAVGEEQTPELMATAMQTLGVDNATQLDINWSYTRFFWFEQREAGLEVTETLLPKMKHRKTGYVQKPEPRDFFYVLRRSGGATQ